MSSYIDAINQASTASTAKSTKDSGSATEATMGKEDFLQLLVAQLQNQDPLNPDEPTEFTAQLAQFSSLEQLFSLNKSMDNLVSSNANSDRLSTLETIGKEVVYSSSKFSFTGDPVELGYQLDTTAAEVKLSIQHNGVVVRTLSAKEMSTGNHFLNWDGLTDSGQVAPSGDYKLILQAKANAEETVSIVPLIRSEVTGVDLEGEQGGTLVTKTGEVAFNTIYGVYDPDSKTDSTADSTTDSESSEETETTADAIADAADAVGDAANAVADATE